MTRYPLASEPRVAADQCALRCARPFLSVMAETVLYATSRLKYGQRPRGHKDVITC